MPREEKSGRELPSRYSDVKNDRREEERIRSTDHASSKAVPKSNHSSPTIQKPSKESMKRSHSKTRTAVRSRSSSVKRRTLSSKHSGAAETTNEDSRSIDSRLYIGNLPTKDIYESDLKAIYKPYGEIRSVSMCSGFGFIQFERAGDARKAVLGEQGSYMNGLMLDVKMASESAPQKVEEKVEKKKEKEEERRGNGRSTPPRVRASSSHRSRPRERSLPREPSLPRKRSLPRVHSLPRKRSLPRERSLPRKRSLPRERSFPRKRSLPRERSLPRKRSLPREHSLPRKRSERSLPRKRSLSKERSSRLDRDYEAISPLPLHKRQSTHERRHSIEQRERSAPRHHSYRPKEGTPPLHHSYVPKEGTPPRHHSYGPKEGTPPCHHSFVPHPDDPLYTRDRANSGEVAHVRHDRDYPAPYQHSQDSHSHDPHSQDPHFHDTHSHVPHSHEREYPDPHHSRVKDYLPPPPHSRDRDIPVPEFRREYSSGPPRSRDRDYPVPLPHYHEADYQAVHRPSRERGYLPIPPPFPDRIYPDEPPPRVHDREVERYGRGSPDLYGRLLPPPHLKPHPADTTLQRQPPIPDPYADRRPARVDHAAPAWCPPASPPARHVNCELVVLNDKQRLYASKISKKLESAGLVTEINLLSPLEDVVQALDKSVRRGRLFAIIIGELNELHRSITVNILHGQPEEHRNMPTEDAISLVVRNYELYRIEQKKLLPPVSKTDFIPPSPATLYLFNLLADNQFLTVEEMDIIVGYIEVRRDRLIELEGGIPRKKKIAMQDKIMEELALAKQESIIRQNVREILRSDAALSVSRDVNTSVYPTSQVATASPPIQRRQPSQPLPSQQHVPQQQLYHSEQQQQQQQLPSQQLAPSNDISVSNILSSKSINFDSPMVQSALDNLIASGPNLLKNISDTFEWNPVADRADKYPIPGVSGGSRRGSQDRVPKLPPAAGERVGYEDWGQYLKNPRPQ